MEDKKVDIFNCGKELFRSKGFKEYKCFRHYKNGRSKVGTFYNYYSSKEKLSFLGYLSSENVMLKQSIMKSLDFDEDPVKIIKKLLSLNISGMNSNSDSKRMGIIEMYSAR